MKFGRKGPHRLARAPWIGKGLGLIRAVWICWICLAASLSIQSAAYGGDRFFGSSANAAGAGGSSYVHEVEVFNPSNSPASIDVCWLPRGQDNSTPAQVTVSLDPGRGTRFENILSDLFGLEPNQVGALKISSTSDYLQFHSRLLRIDGAETTGQSVPAVPVSEAIGLGQQAYILNLSENDEFRSNINCVNVFNTPLLINIDLYDSVGTLLQTRTMNLGPWSNNAINRIFRDFAPVIGHVGVWTPTPGAEFFCFGSVLANVSSDPRSEPAWEPSDCEAEYFIPYAVNSADLSSGLALFAPDGDVQARVDLLRTGEDNTSYLSYDVLVQAGREERVSNVLGSLFGHTGSAALRVSATNGSLMVSSDVTNSFLDGTMREIPVQGSSTKTVYGQTAAVIHLTENVNFRTDIGVVNTSATEIDVVVELHGELGQSLGIVPIQLLPFSHIQLDGVFSLIGYPDVPDGFATVHTTTSSGSFLAYATVTDLNTGDAYHVAGEQISLSIFSDGFESGDTSAWSATVP